MTPTKKAPSLPVCIRTDANGSPEVYVTADGVDYALSALAVDIDKIAPLCNVTATLTVLVGKLG